MSENMVVVTAEKAADENTDIARSGRRTPDGRVPPGLAGYYVGDERLTALCVDCGSDHPDVHEHEDGIHASEYDYDYLRTDSEVDHPGVYCEDCGDLLPTNILAYRHGPGREVFMKVQDSITITAHDCPDDGAPLHLIDDEEAGDLRLRCEDCEALFRAYREEGDLIVEMRL